MSKSLLFGKRKRFFSRTLFSELSIHTSDVTQQINEMLIKIKNDVK